MTMKLYDNAINPDNSHHEGCTIYLFFLSLKNSSSKQVVIHFEIPFFPLVLILALQRQTENPNLG